MKVEKLHEWPEQADLSGLMLLEGVEETMSAYMALLRVNELLGFACIERVSRPAQAQNRFSYEVVIGEGAVSGGEVVLSGANHDYEPPAFVLRNEGKPVEKISPEADAIAMKMVLAGNRIIEAWRDRGDVFANGQTGEVLVMRKRAHENGDDVRYSSHEILGILLVPSISSQYVEGDVRLVVGSGSNRWR